MLEAKNTQRAVVRIGYDGSVHKLFRGPKALDRFENECRVLLYLEQRKCPFVPRLLSANRETLEMVTTNCGARVEHMGEDRVQSIFAELEQYGVRHDDAFLRNITYRATDGRFCVIDFEFSTILDADFPAIEIEKPAESDEQHTDVDERFVSKPIGLSWSAMTHPGSFRTNNEDRFLAMLVDRRGVRYLGKTGSARTDETDVLFAVADGMGGERSGELAGKIAIDKITRVLPRAYLLSDHHLIEAAPAILRGLFLSIHQELVTLGEWDAMCTNMGATLTLAWVHRSTVLFAHVGDTRLYHFHRRSESSSSTSGEMEMTQVTEDHTYVGWLRRRGQINEREARFHPRKNVLSKALGAGNQFVDPQCGTIALQSGDRLLLCTDGIVDGLWDRAIRELVLYPESSMVTMNTAQRLVASAVSESGRDNVTALVVETA